MSTPTQRPRWHPLSIWMLLHEPRVITALHLLGYLILGGGGASALLWPPSSVQAEWGPLLTALWGSALVLGAFIGLVSTPRGIWWGERIGITLLATGLLMYASVVLSLHYSSTGNRLPQAAAILYALVQLAVRWLRIRTAALDPMRGPDGYRPDYPSH